MIIREKDKLALITIFESESTPFEVWAYGSRVEGSAHSGSDLDLVIRSNDLSPIPQKIFSSLSQKIKDSHIPILVELRDWALLPLSFHKNIEQKFEILFKSVTYELTEPKSKYNQEK